MPFKHACFVSYPHCDPASDVLPPFIDALTVRLRSELDAYIGTGHTVYWDKANLHPGSRFNDALAQAMCESACWIIVFVPIYGEHSYCRREYLAMLELDSRRRDTLGSRLPRDLGMIFPIVLRGKIAQLPHEIRDSAHADELLGQCQMSGGNLQDNPTFYAHTAGIATKILDVWNTMRSQGYVTPECNEYLLPDDSGPWPVEPMPFPGR